MQSIVYPNEAKLIRTNPKPYSTTNKWNYSTTNKWNYSTTNSTAYCTLSGNRTLPATHKWGEGRGSSTTHGRPASRLKSWQKKKSSHLGNLLRAGQTSADVYKQLSPPTAKSVPAPTLVNAGERTTLPSSNFHCTAWRLQLLQTGSGSIQVWLLGLQRPVLGRIAQTTLSSSEDGIRGPRMLDQLAPLFLLQNSSGLKSQFSASMLGAGEGKGGLRGLQGAIWSRVFVGRTFAPSQLY